MAAKQKYYERFGIIQRVEHWVMTLSFGLLALTGLPQRYALSGWAQWIINAFGGIESTRIIHRGAAIVLGAVAVFHLIELGYKLFVLRGPATMIPGVKDGLDVYHTVRYNLGMEKEPPKLPRYNFAEKMEYLAVVWGTVLMGITGFMLWNPIATTRALPGQFVPAAKVAHSLEALLAVLAILIWHLWGVHLKTFNKSMFHGKLSRHQMEHEHGLELAEIETGARRGPAVAAGELRKRQLIYLPIALALAVAGGVFLYFFATYEQTAIATVPPLETAKVVVVATPTPRPTVPAPTAVPTAVAAASTGQTVASKPTSIPQVKHPVLNDADCLGCHNLGDFKTMPADHHYADNKMCLVCHRTEEDGPMPTGITHAIEGRTNCATCHGEDKLPQSHKGVGITNEECLTCHEVDKEALAKVSVPVTQPTVVAPKVSAQPSDRPTPVPQIMHALAGHDNCLMCHDAGDIKPMPADHAYPDNRFCLLCHKVEGGGPLPTGITHAVEGRTNCSACHVKDQIPASHQGVKLSDQECLTCHQVDTAALSGVTVPVTQATAEAPKTSAQPANQPMTVPQIKHALAGHENCLMCHDLGDIKPMPADHAYGENRLCTVCHKADALGSTATGIMHAVEGRNDCIACHALDVLPKSHQDAKMTNEDCLMCHAVNKEALAK